MAESAWVGAWWVLLDVGGSHADVPGVWLGVV